MAKIYKRWIRLFLWLGLSVFTIFLIIFWTLQIPYLQKKIIFFIVDQVEEKTNHRIDLGQISINWFDIGVFEQVSLYDFRDSLMFSAEEVVVNFDVFNIYRQGSLHFDGIHIHSTNLNLKKYNDSTAINISQFLRSLSEGNQDRENQTRFFVDEVVLTEFSFLLDDLRKDKLQESRFDNSHFNLHIPAFRMEDLILDGDSVALFIRDFSARDKNSPLIIEKLSSFFTLDKNNLVLADLLLETPYSTIQDSVSFSFTDPSMLSYITDSVDLEIKLSNSLISSKDLALFSSGIDFTENFRLSANFGGRINRLNIQKMDLKTQNGSFFKGRSEFIGLPSIKDTFIDLVISNSRVKEKDIHKYSGDSLLNTGDFSFRGELLGFLNDFVANGRLATRHGVIISDLNLKNPDKPNITEYRGNLQLRSFDLGGLINREEIGKLDFKGSVRGSGLTARSANLYLNATARNVEISGNSLELIKADGRFASRLFSGNLFIDDPALKLTGNADIDFNQEEEILDFTLNIDTIDMYQLGLVDNPLLVTSQVDVDIRNIDLNSARGSLVLDSTVVWKEGKSAFFDQVRLVSNRLNKEKKLYELQAPGINAKLSGDFYLTELLGDVPRTIREFWFNFTEGRDDIREYYSLDQSSDTLEYEAKLEISAINASPYFEVLDIPLELSKNVMLESVFKNKSTKSISLFTEIDSLKFNDRLYLDNLIDINASKFADSSNVLAVAIIESKEQQWDMVSPTSDFFSEIVWFNNTIDLQFKINQKTNNSSANIHSQLRFLRDSIEFKINDSDLTAFGKSWNIRRDNLVRWINDKIIVENLEVYNQDQSINISGVYSDSLATLVNLDFDNFSLENLSAILPRKFEGSLTADGKISRTSANEPLRFESAVDIKGLIFEGYKVGDLDGVTKWDNDIKGLDLSCTIKRNNIKTIQLGGTYIPEKDTDQLDLELMVDQANINLIEPIFSELVSHVEGFASGEFSIQGDLSSPEISGDAELSEGKFTFNYLNTTYTFSGPISFGRDEIIFENIALRDRFQDPATLQGSLKHTNYKNFSIDLELNYTDFELLNTTARMNSLYHGNIYASGDLSVKGPMENIYISSTATTRPNTKVFIPITESTEVGQGSYINFIDPNAVDSMQEDTEEGVDLSGLTLDFDIDVTQDAYVELIFDPRTGDIIRGRGNGNLQMEINTNGDFEMFGGLEISSGAYNFTTSLINKEFQIRPGGTMTWYGDPYNGSLDLEATYRQIADKSDYNDQYSSEKRPVLVVLSLEGSMLTPDIDFSIELEQGNSLVSNEWGTLLQSINSAANNEELKRQVFSLLILRKFSPRESFTVGGLSGVGSSVSEFVSNQLSFWLNQVDENLEVNIDLASLDQEAFNTFQLRLAYTFFDGRLRVTRGGGITTTEENSGSVNNILGDWSVEYLLTEDGNFRVKVFSRNQESVIQSENEQATGVSIQYIKSFNQLRDLLEKSREKAIRRRDEQEKEKSSSD